ncbi:MAG: SGNH/GDSL hydrolase family protein [Leptolyngbyaceae cyanobacterium SU_3_3]|nr:SGNH/GDSL hydrolase family protein [Leptolyngbyaceae cyanobacterium SU_3_3]
MGKSVTTENNFAVGGARTGTDNELNPLFSPLGVTLPGLQQQIDSFKAKNSKADGDALYILWAGANDYLNEQLNLADPVVAQTTINTAVSNLGNAITHLAKIGAKNFLIPNLADLGKLPQTNKNPIVAGGLGLITQSHNDALSQLLKSLPLLNPDSGLNLMSLDVFSLVNQAIADPNSGFTNTTDACLNVPLPFFTGNCSNPDQYLFWDNLHPTAREHQKISDLAYSVLHSKVPPGKSVPEGSAALGVLVVGGVVGCKIAAAAETQQAAIASSCGG